GVGTQCCPDCGVAVEAQTRDELGRRLQAESRRRGELVLLAPVVKNRKGFHTDVADWAAKHGYGQIRADGKIYSTEERLRLDRFREHDVEIVTGRLTPRKGRAAARGSGPKMGQELIEETLKLGNGLIYAMDVGGQVSVHSTERSCPKCGRSFAPLDPKNFSYNSPQGWCLRCRGFGELFYLPDVDRGARAEAIEESWYEWQEGKREAGPECEGTRLNPVARAVRLDLPGLQASLKTPPSIDSLSSMSVEDAGRMFRSLKLKGRDSLIARDILPEIRERLKFLCEVGLGYLQLSRG